MKTIIFLLECLGEVLGCSMSVVKQWIGFLEILIAIAICVISYIFIDLKYGFFIAAGIILGICIVICIVESIVRLIIKIVRR